MKKQTFKGYDVATALKILDGAVKEVGNQKTFAEQHKLDPATLSGVLKGRRPIPQSILDVMGMDAQTIIIPRGN